MKLLIFLLAFAASFTSYGIAAAEEARLVANEADLTFLVEPYIFSHNGDSIQLAWSYSPAPPANVDIIATFISSPGSTQMKVTRENELFTATLPVGTCGFGSNAAYVVTGMSHPEFINGVPCANSHRDSRVIFLADTQADSKQGFLPLQIATDQLTHMRDLNAILIGGDITDHGHVYDLWTRFFNVMGPVLKATMLIPVVGNHEYHNHGPIVPYWQHFFGSTAHDAYYSQTVGDMQFFVLNSCFVDDKSLISAERQWFAEHLEKSTAKWKIVAFHHPPYSSGPMNSPVAPKKEYRVLQKQFVPLFEKYHVNLVLNGHVHIFERSEKNGVQYLTAGATAGKMGIYGNINPYSKMMARIRTITTLQASDNELRVTTTDIYGDMVDDFSIVNGPTK